MARLPRLRRALGPVLVYGALAVACFGGGVALRQAAAADGAAAPVPGLSTAPRPTTTETTWWIEAITTTTRPVAVPAAPPAAAAATTTTAPGPTPAPVAVAVPPDRRTVWFRLADCESGVWGAGKVPRPGSADWAVVDEVDQGGLQIRAGQWDQHRVLFPGFPADAHLATPEQQIAVAEVILAGQGVRAWPTCGPRIGLDVLVA